MLTNAQKMCSIFFAGLMKLLYKLVETEFSSLDPSNFRELNSTGNGTDWRKSTENCRFNVDRSDDASGSQSLTKWIYTARYLIPVLGGLLSSAWLGCNKVLQIGGSLMLLSTVLLSVSVYFGLICHFSPIIICAWLLLPVFYGLIQPNILFIMFIWNRRNKFSTIVSSIHYSVSTFGYLVSVEFVYTKAFRLLGSSFTLLFVAVSFIFLTIIVTLPKIPEEEPFELPTRRRMVKYFQVFSALILFLTFVSDDRPTVYIIEMSHFTNSTFDTVNKPWLDPEWVENLTMVVMAPPMILATFKSRRRLPIPFRMFLGIFLKAAVELFLIVVTLVGLKSKSGAVAVYSGVSIFDGISEFMFMVAAYDLGCSILPTSAQCLILGVMYTVRDLSNLVSHGLLLISIEIFKIRAGSKPLFFVYHLIALLVLMVCFLYHKFVTLKIAAQLSEPEDDIADVHAQLIADDSPVNSNDERQCVLNAS